MFIVSSIVQSCIVFTFLTIFFFTYVAKIERDEFKVQLDLIVDDIFIEYSDKINVMFPDNEDKKDALKTIIYGLLVYYDKKIEKTTMEENKKIDNQNAEIIKDSIYIVLVYIIGCMYVLFVMYLCNVPFDMKEILKEGFLVLFFIFVVEFTFLNVIAKHYISGNANYVLQEITTTIINYIENRQQ